MESSYGRDDPRFLDACPHLANSVAVLPFKTSIPGEEYLGFEIADALVTRLSNSTKLSVSPITAALHYGQGSQDPRTIGSLMKVAYVLYGEIDRTRGSTCRPT